MRVYELASNQQMMLLFPSKISRKVGLSAITSCEFSEFIEQSTTDVRITDRQEPVKDGALSN